MTVGNRILDGLRAAIKGDFSAVTIEGRRFVRSDSAMIWEHAEDAEIDEKAYYVVQHNGHEWRDFDLMVMHGLMVRRRLEPGYVRGRPEWIAKIIRPRSVSITPQELQQGNNK